MHKKISSVAAFVLLLAGFALACNLMPVSPTLEAATSAPSASPSAYPAGPTPTTPANARLGAFAEYPSIPVNLPNSFAGGYSLPVDLSQVAGADLRSHPRRKRPSRITDFSLLLRNRVNSTSSFRCTTCFGMI